MHNKIDKELKIYPRYFFSMGKNVLAIEAYQCNSLLKQNVVFQLNSLQIKTNDNKNGL